LCIKARHVDVPDRKRVANFHYGSVYLLTLMLKHGEACTDISPGKQTYIKYTYYNDIFLNIDPFHSTIQKEKDAAILQITKSSIEQFRSKIVVFYRDSYLKESHF
jgi:hypothetical protein